MQRRPVTCWVFEASMATNLGWLSVTTTGSHHFKWLLKEVSNYRVCRRNEKMSGIKYFLQVIGIWPEIMKYCEYESNQSVWMTFTLGSKSDVGEDGRICIQHGTNFIWFLDTFILFQARLAKREHFQSDRIEKFSMFYITFSGFQRDQQKRKTYWYVLFPLNIYKVSKWYINTQGISHGLNSWFYLTTLVRC